MSGRREQRGTAVESRARWLAPTLDLPPGPAVTVTEGFHRLAVSLLTVIQGDSPQLVVGLQYLIEARDACVRAALDGAFDG